MPTAFSELLKVESFKVFNKFAKIYFQLDVLGEENLPSPGDTNAFFVMSHTAFFGLDAYLLASIIANRGMDRPISTLVWRRFLEGPLGAWFKKMGCIEASVDNAVEHLRLGNNLLIMPEGTDGTDVRNRMNTFHTGYLRIVRQAPVPIIPVGFYGIDQSIPWWVTTNQHVVKKMMEPLDIGLDFYLFPKFPAPRPTKVVFAIGEPILFSPQELQTEEQIQHANHRVKGIVSELIDRCETRRERALDRSPLNRLYHKIVAGDVTCLPF